MTANNIKLLFVEDDQELVELLFEFLKSQDFSLVWEPLGSKAVERILAEQPHLVILDLMLPGMSGLEICRNIRDHFEGAIMMLTASQSEFDHISGLEFGADDFVIKPIDPRVLLARINTLLRRTLPQVPQTDLAQDMRYLKIASLKLDLLQHQTWVNATELELTSMEFKILTLLVQNAGSVVRRDEFYQEAMGRTYDGLDRGLDIHMSRIRRKLDQAGFELYLLRSIRGVGYLMGQA